MGQFLKYLCLTITQILHIVFFFLFGYLKDSLVAASFREQQANESESRNY